MRRPGAGLPGRPGPAGGPRIALSGAPATAPAQGADKLLGIELLRFVCACAVLLWHYQHFSYVANQAHQFEPARQPLYAALGLFYRYGLYGVQVFWCISGFIFFWKYGAAIAGRHIGARRFFLLRLSRLYPLHLFTLLLVAALQAVYFAGHQYYFVYRDNSPASFLLQLGLASHWFYPLTGFSFNGPVWSISLEVLAYLCFFLYTRRAGAGLPATAGAALAAGLAWRYCDWPLFECLLYFYLGALVALAGARLATLGAPARHGCNLAAAALLATLPAWAPGPSTILLAGTPLLIHLLLQYVRPRRPALQRLLGGLGNLTYASYLLHFPLQIVIALVCAAWGRAIPLYSPALLAGFVALSFLLAHFCYHRLEMPLQRRLRARFG
ncbi:acyltransferase [Janthinobacterium sp. BJB412]|nr:acyltransferase [Janthinobacterium sp. BJB412]